MVKLTALDLKNPKPTFFGRVLAGLGVLEEDPKLIGFFREGGGGAS